MLTHRRLILSPRFHLGNGVNFLGVKHDLRHEQRHYRPLLHHIPLFLNCQHSGDHLSTFELGFQIDVVVIKITMQILSDLLLDNLPQLCIIFQVNNEIIPDTISRPAVTRDDWSNNGFLLGIPAQQSIPRTI